MNDAVPTDSAAAGADTTDTADTRAATDGSVAVADGSLETEPLPVDEPIVSLHGDVVLAIDIGSTVFQAGLVTGRGRLIDRARVPRSSPTSAPSRTTPRWP